MDYFTTHFHGPSGLIVSLLLVTIRQPVVARTQVNVMPYASGTYPIFVLFNFFFFYSLSPNKFFYYYYYYFSLHRFSNHLRLEHVLRLDLILNFLSRWYFDLYMRETLMACEIHQVKLFVYLIWFIYVLFFFLRTGRSVRDLRECHQRRGGSMHVCHGN